MKFEINENKLEMVIFKYLDNKNFIIKETDYNYYFLENEEDEYAQIRVRKNDMFCFIRYNLTEEINSFFSINYSATKDVLIKYVENVLDVKVYNISGKYPSHIFFIENT